jgi:hypothetical protein
MFVITTPTGVEPVQSRIYKRERILGPIRGGVKNILLQSALNKKVW